MPGLSCLLGQNDWIETFRLHGGPAEFEFLHPKKSEVKFFGYSSSWQSQEFMLKFGYKFGAWCNGSTPDFESVDLGSTPSAPAELLWTQTQMTHTYVFTR